MESNDEKITLTELALLFLKLGATSFGGAMLPLIEETLVHQRKWVKPEDFVETVALAQLVPGPVTLKVAAYMGYLLRGLRGLVIAAFFFTVPSIVLVLLGSFLLFQNHQRFAFQKLLTFVDPIVVAAFLATTYRLGRQCLAHPLEWIVAVAAFTATWMKVSPLLVLLSCGLIGLGVFAPLGIKGARK